MKGILLGISLCVGMIGQTVSPPNGYPFSVSAPTGVTSVNAQVHGNTGSGSYYYWVVANNAAGQLFTNVSAQVANAPNIFSGGNFVRVLWGLVPGTTTYDVLRTTTPTLPGSCTCAVATGLSSTTGSQDDTGAGLSSYNFAPVGPSSGSITLSNATGTRAFIFNPTIPGGATVASTNNALKGDGAGNAIAVTGTGTNCVLVNGTSGACGSGSGTVTNVATTAPISGGPITTTGTITCPTCATSTPTNHGVSVGSSSQTLNFTTAGTSGQVLTSNGASADPTFQTVSGSGTVTVVAAGSLTSTALVTGGGGTTIQTPSATATLDTSGNLGTPGSVTTGVGGATTGSITFSGGTSGSAAITVAAVAGTPNPLALPTTSGTNGQKLTTNGANPQQLSWSNTVSSCQPGLGDGLNSMSAATYLQSECFNLFGVTYTIDAIYCYTDNAGASTLNVTNGAGTGLLTGAITCGSTFPGVAGTQSGTTTIASLDGLKFTFVADGTSKQTTWSVKVHY
jgi:hypothetical protein